MTKREIKADLKASIADMVDCGGEDHYGATETPYRSVYIGSALSLDPCGRYHHILSPNGVTSRCERYWANLEAAAEELGGWIESGEGDPLDTYFCLPIDSQDSEQDSKEDN